MTLFGKIFSKRRSSTRDAQYDSGYKAPAYNRPPHHSQASLPAYAVPYHPPAYTTPPGPSPVSELGSPYPSDSTYHTYTPSPGYATPAHSQNFSPSQSYPATQSVVSSPHFQPGTQCPQCPGINQIYHTKSNRWNINSGRPYRKCVSCGSWNGFTDSRGLNPGNPLCNCQAQSRLTAKRDKNRNGLQELFYTCQFKTCTTFHEEYRYDDGTLAQLNDVQIRGMVDQGLL